jgi:predicted metal-dependent peptidase
VTADLDRQKVAAARLWAASKMPYLANALFACTISADRGSGTIGIDRGWQVRTDPDVAADLDVEQLGRLLLHLVAHVLRDHAGRAERLGIPARNQNARWNRCADAEINDDLVDADCVPGVAPDLPEDLSCDDGQLVEAYFESADDGPRRWDCGSGADACPRPGDRGGGIAAEQAELLRLAVAAEIHRQHAREPGTIAGGWLRWAEDVLPSRVDWRRVLAAEIRHAVATIVGNVDYSYRRPSRRAHLTPDVVLPRLVRPVPEVAIVCDTSGSMDEHLLGRALAEIEAMLQRAGLRQANVRVLAVDAAVQTVKRVSRASHVELAGGGGTDMGTGIEAAAALRPRPSVIIVLTDGYTPWPARPPRDARVIVGLLDDGGFGAEWPTPRWAKTIVIDEAGERLGAR